ncbi:MAG TPA: TetR/AcrR family transcriptional regulator [Polyangiaceae bacterium]|jgi:AcrR family transcriptional regulator|nr:TetR/AcrR family transcriptional regulator [Polyangiaceae bacterium]
MARPRTDIAPRIRVAARRHFLKNGVDGATLRAIAREAGTSIGMIYYYFPTKDDLFFAVVEEQYAKVLADMEQALSPEFSVNERLHRLFERIAEVHDEEAEVLRLVAQEGLKRSERFQRLVERFLAGHVPLILRTLMDGMQGGVLDAKRHPIVLLLATAGLAGPPQFIRRALGDRVPVPGAPSGKALAHELVDVLLHGIAPAG